MGDELHLSPALTRVHAKKSLANSLKTKLNELFHGEIQHLKGDVELVKEILICVESLRVPLQTDQEKLDLFFEVYGVCFGQVTADERILLTSVVTHLREAGLIIRRSRWGEILRRIARLFRN